MDAQLAAFGAPGEFSAVDFVNAAAANAPPGEAVDRCVRRAMALHARDCARSTARAPRLRRQRPQSEGC